VERNLAVALALARLIFCGYRAVHQSIVIDEAYTYLRFIRGPWSVVYSPYDANNHVLNTILAKLCIQFLGLSEFAMRLPSLLSGFFLILGIYFVLELTTSRAIRWIAVFALALHPALLDFSIAARGYGTALAFLIWALYFSLRRRYAIAGVLLGLAFCANLTTIFPALALILAATILSTGRASTLASLFIPAAAVAFVISYPALRTAQKYHFYIGNPTLTSTVGEIVTDSLHGAPALGFLAGARAVHAAQFIFVPAIFAFILIATRRAFPAVLPALTLAFTLLGLIAAHTFFGLNYPIGRTALYLPLLFCIAWAIASDNARHPALRGANLLLAALLIAQFTTQIQTESFHPWVFDEDTRHVAELLKQACAGKPDQSISIGATWIHQPALEFYRDALPIPALQPVVRQSPAELLGHDFYVLNDPDTAALPRANLQILFSGKSSGIVLAASQ